MGLCQRYRGHQHARVRRKDAAAVRSQDAGQPEDAPHGYAQPMYGAKQQFAVTDKSPALDEEGKKRIQEIVGTLLYYARAIDSTLLPALNTIAAQQAQATQNTVKAVEKLLNYCASHPTGMIRYYASDMVLWVDSDASYLTAPKARSRAAGFHYLSSRPTAINNGTGQEHTAYERRHSRSMPDNEGSFVQCGRGQTGQSISQWEGSRADQDYVGRIGARAAAHTYANRQQHRDGHCQTTT